MSKHSDALSVVTKYLIHQPEQGDWPWEDHCEGLASGILRALRDGGHLDSSEAGS